MATTSYLIGATAPAHPESARLSSKSWWTHLALENSARVLFHSPSDCLRSLGVSIGRSARASRPDHHALGRRFGSGPASGSCSRPRIGAVVKELYLPRLAAAGVHDSGNWTGCEGRLPPRRARFAPQHGSPRTGLEIRRGSRTALAPEAVRCQLDVRRRRCARTPARPASRSQPASHGSSTSCAARGFSGHGVDARAHDPIPAPSIVDGDRRGHAEVAPSSSPPYGFKSKPQPPAPSCSASGLRSLGHQLRRRRPLPAI